MNFGRFAFWGSKLMVFEILGEFLVGSDEGLVCGFSRNLPGIYFSCYISLDPFSNLSIGYLSPPII